MLFVGQKRWQCMDEIPMWKRKKDRHYKLSLRMNAFILCQMAFVVNLFILTYLNNIYPVPTSWQFTFIICSVQRAVSHQCAFIQQSQTYFIFFFCQQYKPVLPISFLFCALVSCSFFSFFLLTEVELFTTSLLDIRV